MSRTLFAAVLLAAVVGCQRTPSPAPGPAAPSSPAASPAASADAPQAAPPALDIALPTGNRALLDGRPERFYMGLNTTIDSLREERWEGGQYGFVRDPVPTRFGWDTFRRVHEGVDIAPLYRDADGEPLDTVRAIAAGTVAYASAAPGASSYGRYVVVEHDWSGTPVYSLYAHLDSVGVAAGDAVGRGSPLGRLGYSGRGLGRARAHVHLEVALMLNRHEPAWFAQYVGGPDLHGRFFGTNLAGVDPAALFLAQAADPGLTFPDFVAAQDEAYVVDLPGGQPLDLLARYPWLGADGAAEADPAAVAAWRVTFTQTGLPIRVETADAPVERATVDGASLYLLLTDASTNRLLHREDVWGYVPSQRGYAYFALLAATAGGVPQW